MPRLSNGDRAIHAAIEAELDEDEAPAIAAAPAARAGLGAEDLARLRDVLATLTTCRQMIDAAVARLD
jgi:putative NIF3 family GTP cyclohydrolase 1 type 2